MKPSLLLVGAGIAVAVATVPRGAVVSAEQAKELTPTFAKHVAPILYRSCVTCHRPGEVAPMSLISYDDVRPWARSIRAKVLAREMPPWHADPQHGKFSNDL